MTHFTQEQLKELETIYGLKRAGTDVLLVRDGYVNRDSKVWWRGDRGPEHVVAGDHWTNVQKYPEVYQLKEPARKTVYVD